MVPVYSGPLIQIPDASVLAQGSCLWVILVDQVADGMPTGEFADSVLTVIQ